MAKGKNVLTTGEVAKICSVAPRTVSKWFDSGQLKGYRIPGSKDRRIPISELIKFMKANNIPTTALSAGKIRILIVGKNGNLNDTLTKALQANTEYEVQIVESNFETGAIAQKFLPHVMLINLLAHGINSTEICKNVHENEELQTIKIIAIANQLTPQESAALLQKGFDDYITNPNDFAEIIRKIELAIAIIY